MLVFADIGSTFTKVVAVDPCQKKILGTAKAYTTVETDVTIGLVNALKVIGLDDQLEQLEAYASSSAAGGLKVVAIGLVPSLTVEAAKRVALSAGSKVVGTYGYRLTKEDIKAIEALKPDIILLAGGTDGGDEQTIKYNAGAICASSLSCPIIVAGNRVCSEEVAGMLHESGRTVETCANIMPEVNMLAVDEARDTLRMVFLRNIIQAKGIDKVKSLVQVLMPTPMAVLDAVQLVAEGTLNQVGLGETILFDVGGATTDVHSAATGIPSNESIYSKGLPEPYAKRTVEGDIGVRYNADTLLSTVKDIYRQQVPSPQGGSVQIETFCESVNSMCKPRFRTPETDQECAADAILGRTAVKIGMNRHAGTIEEVYSPNGKIQVLYGKDLRSIPVVIGTGGPVIYSKDCRWILEGCLYSENEPFILKPVKPRYFLDKNYCMFAVGLMSKIDKELAFKIAMDNLAEV